MSSRGRVQSDGSITFIPRGDFPEVPPGYTVDPDDPYRLILEYQPCKFRELQKKIKCEFGKIIEKDFCNHFNIPINPAYCKDCTEREE